MKVENHRGPVVQSVVSLTSSLRVISLTVLADSIYNILIFFAENCDSHFFSKKFKHICISLNVKFNESLTNDVVSFEQLGPRVQKTLTDSSNFPPSHKEISPTVLTVTLMLTCISYVVVLRKMTLDSPTSCQRRLTSAKCQNDVGTAPDSVTRFHSMICCRINH